MSEQEALELISDATRARVTEHATRAGEALARAGETLQEECARLGMSADQQHEVFAALEPFMVRRMREEMEAASREGSLVM
jgi:hypothetical protein